MEHKSGTTKTCGDGKEDYFRCKSGQCVTRWSLCKDRQWWDGEENELDCDDGSHQDFCENNCGEMESNSMSLRQNRFQCDDGECIEEGSGAGPCNGKRASSI